MINKMGIEDVCTVVYDCAFTSRKETILLLSTIVMAYTDKAYMSMDEDIVSAEKRIPGLGDILDRATAKEAVNLEKVITDIGYMIANNNPIEEDKDDRD